MTTSPTYKAKAFHRGEPGPNQCDGCGQPDDETVCALAAEFRSHFPEWSSRRAWDRAWIAAAKGAKPLRNLTRRTA